MPDDSAADAPLHAVAAGEQAAEAFELLGNETRLAILVALWESYDPFDASSAVRFSELRQRVGTTDSGQFNYHLDRLDGHFVASTDAGYRLSEAGLKFVRSVIAGAGIEEPTLDPTEVDATCTLCGAPVQVTYEGGWLYVLCTACDGLWAGSDDRRPGHLAKFSLDPAGLVDRSPGAVYAAAWVTTFQHIYTMIEGVCPTCTGPVERALEVCDDHDDEGRCANCGRRVETIARLRCTVCKDWARATLGVVAKYHPAVISLCHEHGLDLQYGINDLGHFNERLERTSSSVEHVSADPRRLRVTTEIDGEAVWLELDETLAVVDAGA